MVTQANAANAHPDWPQVVVAGAYLTGVVLMRNLVRRGVRASCIDCNDTQPGFRTVYGKGFLCPNPDEEPDRWLEFMYSLADKIGGKPVLIPSADQFVTAITDHADALKGRFTFCSGAAAIQGLLATKKRQYQLADEYGLLVPKTRFIDSALDLEEFAASSMFPCILKPIHFREWERFNRGHPLYAKKLVISHSPEELLGWYNMACEASHEAVVQEIIEGPDTAKMCYLSCYGKGGRRIASCMVRQVRTAPIHFGSASIVEPVSDPETETLCDAFLQRIGYEGLCELELKRDSRDGQVKLIEANPRYSVTADAAPYIGVDLGWLHYLDLIGQPVHLVQPTSRDFRHIVLFRDFSTIRSYRKEGLLSWTELLWSYRPPVAFFDLDIRDWRITIKNLDTLMRLALGPTLRRFFPKRSRPQ